MPALRLFCCSIKSRQWGKLTKEYLQPSYHPELLKFSEADAAVYAARDQKLDKAKNKVMACDRMGERKYR